MPGAPSGPAKDFTRTAVRSPRAMMLSPRKHDKTKHGYADPSLQVNFGLWTLFAGALFFLSLRVWIKITRRHGLWWDDYILIVTMVILAVNNSLITTEFATGYVTETWDDRMQILINITSCGTLIGQALSKTAFAVTLIKLTKGWYHYVFWFIIVSMNSYMFVKVIFQWAKLCDKASYDKWYRLNFCLSSEFREEFKEGGNVYNIIMDFILASFPWIITWNLDMRKIEKIGLCVTMSLGMVVAIVAAIRTAWKDAGNPKDYWYFWRNGHSNIWYSSEIVGTVIVQCIPVLRPFLRAIKTSMTSKRLGSTNADTAQQKFPATIGSYGKLRADMYSDLKMTNVDESSELKDSWDGQGIYQKREFELTTMDAKSSRSDAPIV